MQTAVKSQPLDRQFYIVRQKSKLGLQLKDQSSLEIQFSEYIQFITVY